MPPWLFNVYIDVVVKGVKIGMGRIEMRSSEERRKWIFAGLLYVDNLTVANQKRT